MHLRHEIKELQRKLGVTAVMVTHDQEEALAMADRIVVMNDGEIEQGGSPNEVYREPVNLFVADFIGEMNQITSTVAKGGRLSVGEKPFACHSHSFGDGTPIVVAIRPENIIPHEADYVPDDGHQNCIEVLLHEMEFLGSFWRCRLQNERFGTSELIADFSNNAVRRLRLGEGRSMTIALPIDRLMAFDRPEAAQCQP